MSHPEANDVHLHLLRDINFDHLVSVTHINFEMTIKYIGGAVHYVLMI